jgi:DNA helicase-2/ATP-dependent DNA helicase PcrA
VAAEIRGRLERGASPGSIAVLVRTNADAAPVLASLDVRGVPRRFSGASGLFARSEVRELLSLMRVLVSPSASEDLYGVLTSPVYGLGGEDLTAICEMAARRRRTLWSVVTEVLDQPGLLRLSAETRRRLARCASQLRSSIEAAHERSAPAVLYEHLRESGWLTALVAQAERGDDGPLRRVARLFEIVRQQSDLLSDPRLAALTPILQGLVDAGQDPAVPEEDDDPAAAVSVLTVHQAKGLEFPTVYVIGLAEHRFPIQARRDVLALPAALTGRMPSEDAGHRAEERRLFYVAMTRARDELILSHAVRGAHGGRLRRPSGFIAEALGRPVMDQAPGPGRIGLAPPPEVAQASVAPAPKPGPDGGPLELSFTQVDDYLTCPRRYHLRHVARVPTAPNHALVFGNAIHQAVAVANAARLRGEPADVSRSLETLAAHWSSEGFLSAEHEAARFASGQAALRRYVERLESDEASSIVAVEQPFSVRIGPDRIRGRYDAVRTVDGRTVITDYKSGDTRDPVKARERARNALQLQIYALAWEAEHGRRPDAVELHFLEGDVIGRVTPTDAQLERARTRVASASAGIRAAAFEATPGFPACDWCPYRRICPAAL